MAPLFSVRGDERPNFVLIVCDDLGYGDLSCYGHPHIKTPHLDGLAAEGIRWTDFYATAPVCSSSRAGLLTGRIPNRTGVYDWIPPGHVAHLPRTEVTVATLLRDAGYDTAHSGKWHLNGKFNSEVQPQPGDHGFDHWFSTQNNASPSHAQPRNFVRNGEPVGQLEGFSCQEVVHEAIRWLDDRSGSDAPFFLNLWFHEPHEPVASPQSMVEGYAEVTESVDQAQYFANVQNMDAAVGRLLEALSARNLSEDTLVLFTSDNGPETLRRYRGAERSYGSPGPLRGMKLHIYDGGIRVAGILRWPGKVASGSVSSTPVGAVDVFPTFLELAGVAIPTDRTLDGTSWANSLRRRAAITREKPLFWNYYRALGAPKVAMRDGDWKIVAHWDGPERPLGGNVNPDSMALIKGAELTRMELYNMSDDIGEARDLSSENPEKLREMETRLRSLYADVRAEGPVWMFAE